MLFSISVFWFYRIALFILKNAELALISAAIYGFSPFFIGFLFYTLTEGITPALLLCFVFLLIKAYEWEKGKNFFYLFASFVFSYLFIVRPVLGIFGLLLPVFLFSDHQNKKIKFVILKLFAFGTIALSLMIAWQIRNYKIAGKYVGLHPIYFEDNNTIYREPFRQFWNFAGGRAERGDRGFSYMIPVWQSAINDDTSGIQINNAIDSLPDHVKEHFGEARLAGVLRDYQGAVLYQKPFYDKQLPMPMEFSPIEMKSINEFKKLTKEYRTEFWYRYYFLSPLKVYSLMSFHSNLSLYIFQKTFRGTFLMETTRFIFYSIHGLCFIFLLVNIFMVRKNILIKSVIALFPFCYVFYLCFVQRGIEERYTLPVLPFLFIGMIYSLKYFYFLLKEKRIDPLVQK
jgi:hypothetical protein